MLLEIVPPERKMQEVYVKYFMPLSSIAIMIALAVTWFWIWGSDWPPMAYVLVAAMAAMEFSGNLIVGYGVGRLARPFSVYQNGFEGYRSLVLQLRGMDRFFHKSEIESIEIAPFDEGQQIAKSPSSMITDPTITARLRDGRTRVIGRRSLPNARRIARLMSEHWTIPLIDRTAE